MARVLSLAALCVVLFGGDQARAATIFIQLPDSQKIDLSVENSDLILTVEQKIFAEEGFPIVDQRLYFGDEPLASDLTLADYDIQKESTLSLQLVPEPSAWILMMAGVGALGAAARRSRRAAGMDVERAETVRRDLGLDGLTVRLAADFDDPGLSRQVLGLDDSSPRLQATRRTPPPASLGIAAAGARR